MAPRTSKYFSINSTRTGTGATYQVERTKWRRGTDRRSEWICTTNQENTQQQQQQQYDGACYVSSYVHNEDNIHGYVLHAFVSKVDKQAGCSLLAVCYIQQLETWYLLLGMAAQTYARRMQVWYRNKERDMNGWVRCTRYTVPGTWYWLCSVVPGYYIWSDVRLGMWGEGEVVVFLVFFYEPFFLCYYVCACMFVAYCATTINTTFFTMKYQYVIFNTQLVILLLLLILSVFTAGTTTTTANISSSIMQY